MEIKKAQLLFEQSGTFKSEFKKLGIPAEDYDIFNDFGETDHVIDLYTEIDSEYKRERERETIFGSFSEQDILFAFFPCVRFENQILLSFRGEQRQLMGKSDEEKLMIDLKLHEELHRNYELITELAIIAKRRNLRLIIENPYSSQHYLTRYWCLKPSLIDYDRTDRGDIYKKPTQYWFINCKPSNNFIFEAQEAKEIRRISYENGNSPQRSMITHEYANRFIREFLL